MTNVTEAKKLCPDLVAQHVATWKEGEDKWAYHPDAAANISTHKVSLDPYRLQSRKILALVKECLPSNLQKVEKASIDEVFLDLSAQIHAELRAKFPELSHPPPNNDLSQRLPLPSVSALDWEADCLVDLDEADAEIEDPDWDDVALLVGSEIVRGIRAEIYTRLGYTCSAGISRNKMLSKLGSAHKKPNQQTVIRGRAVQHFLSGLKFTKIRMLGGKLGDQIKSTFDTDLVRDLLPVPVDQLKAKLGDETGVWIYNTIRGVDLSEVNSRTQIKSMLSAKAFRPSITTFDQAVSWLRIFVGDIFSRLVEEGVLENKRRPKTITLHHLQGNQTRSRQSPIQMGKPLDEALMLDLSKGLLNQVLAEANIWPCAHLSLSVTGFEDGVIGNMGISSFLVKGDDAKALRHNSSDGATGGGLPLVKKRRVDNGGIQQFFKKQEIGDFSTASPSTTVTAKPHEGDNGGEALPVYTSDNDFANNESSKIDKNMPPETAEAATEDGPIRLYMCSRCPAQFETSEDAQSHDDWHFAKDLQEREERVNSAFARRPARPAVTGSRRTRGKKLEQGQRRLQFD